MRDVRIAPVDRCGRSSSRFISAVDYAEASLAGRMLIHPSARKGNSANFAFHDFCELPIYGVLRSSQPSL